jgi:hypothetical protein
MPRFADADPLSTAPSEVCAALHFTTDVHVSFHTYPGTYLPIYLSHDITIVFIPSHSHQTSRFHPFSDSKWPRWLKLILPSHPAASADIHSPSWRLRLPAPTSPFLLLRCPNSTGQIGRLGSQDHMQLPPPQTQQVIPRRETFTGRSPSFALDPVIPQTRDRNTSGQLPSRCECPQWSPTTPPPP